MTVADVLFAETGDQRYNAVEWRRMMRALCDAAGGQNGSGVIAGACAVTERGSGANLSVDVAAGGAFVAGASAAQGSYFAYWDAAINVTLSTADATNPRIDLIVAQVHDDNVDSGGTFVGQPEKVTGTPSGTPAVPATPARALVLAQVLVAANASVIHNAQITDLRPELPRSLAIQTSLSVGTTATAGTSVTTPVVRATTGGAVGLATNVHAVQAGPTGGQNIAASGTSVQARNSTAAAPLNLNPLGGLVKAGDGGFWTDYGLVTAGVSRVGTISGVAYFTTQDRWSQFDYGLGVSDSGNTYLNCQNPGTIFLKYGGAATSLMSITDSGGTAQWKIPDGLPILSGNALVFTSGQQIGYSTSSRRYKENIVGLRSEVDAPAAVGALSPSVFQYKAPTEAQDLSEADTAALVARRPGFIAEDVAGVIPRAAHYDQFGQPDGIDTTALVAVLWDAVQQLTARVHTLENP